MLDKKYQDMISKAMYLAMVAHKGQLYGSKDYFLYHIMPVAEKAMNLLNVQHPIYNNASKGQATVYVAALLHDIVEDTDVTIEYLSSKGISNEALKAVELLTKKHGQNNEEYINLLMENKIARIVKNADSLINLENSIISKRLHGIKKYTNNLALMAGI